MFNKLKKNRNSANLSNSAELPAAGPLAMGQQTGGITQHNTITAAPIIQETVRNDRVIEVQPVLHREIDRNIVHHVEKHIHEPAAPTMQGTIERPALVQQEVHTNVVNEIQPIIHRERVVPVVERSERHLTERVSGGTVHTHEVVFEQGQGFQQQGFQQGYQQQGFQQQGFQQGYGSNQFINQAQPTITSQPIGVMHQTQAVPLYAPPMGVPYGTGINQTVADSGAGARTGKRHHHGVLHRNAKQ